MEHSLETLDSCPSCLSKSFTVRLTPTDQTFSKDSFTIVHCNSCSLLYTNPRPTAETIGKYYDNPEYVSHTDTKSGPLFWLYGLVKKFTLWQKRSFLDTLSKERTILDYGAGTGDFSANLADNGWSVLAFEPDQIARQKIAEKNSNVKLVNDLAEIPDHSISVICLWHVLEHVHLLAETLSQFHRILNINGTLIVAVPNCESFDAQHYKELWAAYDVPRHLYHFTPKSFKGLMSAADFQVTQLRPMWFDSFYVSLLSEKNNQRLSGPRTFLGWTSAFIIGLISNIRAIRHPERCSSVTYVCSNAI